MKKLLCILLAVSMVLSFVAIGAAAEDIKVLFNGEALKMDQAPIIRADRVLVPMRAIFEALGASVDWNAETKTATATRGDITVSFTINENKMFKNSTAIALDTASVIENSRTLVPVRAVSEAFGASVNWDDAERAVIIATETSVTDEAFEDTDPLDSKYFTITQRTSGKNVSVENSSLEANAKIITAGADANDDFQAWSFTLNGDGEYVITNKKSGRSFDVPGASKDVGKNIAQYDTNSNANQTLAAIKNADGTYSFKFKHSSMYFTISNGYATQEAQKGDDTQCFTLTYVGKSSSNRMGVVAGLFMLEGADKVNNAKLQWNAVSGATSYKVYRAKDGGEYELLQSLSGITIDDYDLDVESGYVYYVKAYKDTKLIAAAFSDECKPYVKPDCELKTYSNVTPSSFNKPNGNCIDGVYYKFSSKSRTDGGKGFGQYLMSTSTDDINYTEPVEVMNVEEILAHPTSEGITDCRFESKNLVYNKKTNKFFYIAHMEKASGYGFARVSIASATPGERFTFHGSFRPTGNDARDMNVYVDDDGSAYITTAINGNADLALYKLTEDWTGIEKKMAIVNKGKWRELPTIIKRDGIYYLFSSGTAGWYPTRGMYNTATNLAGPWSGLKTIGNINTFSSQSGWAGALKKDSDHIIMTSYRWMYYWKDVTLKQTMNRSFDTHFTNGFAFYDYYDEFLFSLENDVFIPIQKGRLLSQGKSATAQSNSDKAGAVNDGSYFTSWSAKNEWPTSWTVDLGEEHKLSAMQITWYMKIGSEGYYNYILEGSSDNVNFTTILDKSSGYTDYGFTTDTLSGSARYVRLRVLSAKQRNSDTNTYTPQIFEVKIFGE